METFDCVRWDLGVEVHSGLVYRQSVTVLARARGKGALILEPSGLPDLAAERSPVLGVEVSAS